MNVHTIEKRVRRNLLRQGYQLHKSRARNWSYDNQCGYMIVDPIYNFVVAGPRFDLTLQDVIDFADVD